MKRAVVTGGSGYIGKNLVERLLNDGYEVHVLTRTLPLNLQNRYNLYFHKVCVSTESVINAMDSARPNIVFHLASLFIPAHTPDNINGLINSNVLFGTQILEAMVKFNIKYFVNTGTSWQHFENESYNPVNLYAATKQAFESILMYYDLVHDIKSTTMVIFDTYGPSDTRQKLISNVFNVASENLNLKLSPGEQLLDYVYIDDVIDAFIVASKLMCNGYGIEKKYGISSGKNISLKALIQEIENVANKAIDIEWGGRPYRQREVMVPWEHYNKLPEWEPKVDLREGLLRVWDSIKDEKNSTKCKTQKKERL